MKIFMTLGIKNLQRNKKRTLLTLFVLTLGMASLIFFDALMIGLLNNMIATQTSTFMGDAQIHHTDFLDEDSYLYTIPNYNEALDLLKEDKNIFHISSRTIADAMLSSSYYSQIVKLYGIDGESESKVSKIKSSIVKGDYTRLNQEDAIILGLPLAEKMALDLGDKVIISIGREDTGEVIQTLFRVEALYSLNHRILDEYSVFINIDKSRNILGLKDFSSNEIAIRFLKRKTNSDVIDSLKARILSKQSGVLKTWDELAKSLKSILEMSEYSIYVIFILLFIFVSLAVSNTIFMGVFERKFEIAIMKAIGTKPSQVFQIIFFETLSLGVIGTILGVLIGSFFIYISNVYGITSFQGVEYGGVNLGEQIVPQFRQYQFTVLPAAYIFISFFSAMYPSWYASQISLKDAFSKNL